MNYDGMVKTVKFGKELDLLEIIWKRLNNTQYANWSYRSKLYQSGKTSTPRIVRIKKAIKSYYGVDLKIVKHKRKK